MKFQALFFPLCWCGLVALLVGSTNSNVDAFVVPSGAPGTTSDRAKVSARTTGPSCDLSRLKSTEATTSTLSGNTKFELDDVSMRLLDEAVAFNATAAMQLLSKISIMRESGTSEEYLDALLVNGPDSSLPFWTRSKRLARFSRRARMASFRRTLDRTTPPVSDNESTTNVDDDKEQQVKRRRRALVALLRNLANEANIDSTTLKEPLIVRIERRSLQAEKDDATNLRKRLPEGLETPDYEIIASAIAGGKNVEIRKYKPYSVCAVSMNKPRPEDSSKTDAKVQMPEMSGASSFGALAGYLFGKNDQSTAMKMTTPVFTSPLGEGDRQMEFVLPSNYWGSLMSAPKPLDESGVTLQEKASEDRAVIMFGGYASKKEVDRRKKELIAALSQDPEWKMLDDEVTVAQYNDPFTVPWKRLNEVSVRVGRR